MNGHSSDEKHGYSGGIEVNEEIESNEKESKFDGYMTVVGGMVLHLACGNQYIWGNIAGYIISYFHYAGDMNATTKITFSVKPFQSFATILFGFIGAMLFKKIAVRT